VYGPFAPPARATVRIRPCADRRPGMGPDAVEPDNASGALGSCRPGHVSPDGGVPGSGPAGGAAVMRGPMAGRVVRQLLRGTNWGRLDVLIPDLPPGTGDVHLEACKSLSGHGG